MDSIQNIKCKKHQLKDIEFIQVNEVLNQPEDKQIFYCSQCINSDIQFQGINYLLIEQIITEGSSNILLKWPPVSDCQVLQKLIDLTTNQNDQFNFVQQITSYFTDFKDQLITKLDHIQKIMINKALDQQFNKELIVKKYQDISNILTLKQLIQDNQDLDASSLEFKGLITKQESEKVKNTELLQNLVNQITTKQEKISFGLPDMIKEQIFLLFNQISFFKEENSLQQNLDKRNQRNLQGINNNSQNVVDQVMSLISNKSNFCSDQFLDSIKKDLNNLSLLFQNYTFSNVFKENKQPIKFDNISDQNFQLINEYVDHQILLGSNQNYKNTIEQSEKVKLTVAVLNSKFNFLNENFMNEIKKYLVDNYPFLKQVAYNNFITDENKFNLFQNLPNETISILSQVLSKSFEYEQNNKFIDSLSHFAIQKNKDYFNEQQMEQLLQKLPFFDVLQINKIENNNFFATNFQNGKQRLIVNKLNNQELEIYLNQSGNWVNIFQDYILKKDKKYIYRFQVQNNKDEDFMIGLAIKKDAKNDCGYRQCLSCYLINLNGYLKLRGNFGVNKQIKGENLKWQQNGIFEMRVDLQNKILEISDYPNYEFILQLEDNYKDKLIQVEDLSLYIGLYNSTKIILKEAYQVGQFANYY
ncbi:hypothetical protein ABPG72_014025 [Tetrahymena utriculariae]